MRIFSFLWRTTPARQTVAAAPAQAPAPVVPKLKLDAGPGLAHESSRKVFQAFLVRIGSGSGELTGLYNVETGQIICGGNSHHGLAAIYGLEVSPKPALLASGWYGFRCLVVPRDATFNISPESGLYGILPAEHLPAFQAAMGRLFAGNELFGKGATYETESAAAQRRRAEARSAQVSCPPAAPAAATPLSSLQRLGEAVAVATREQPNFENIAQTLVDHCLIRLYLGDQPAAIIADLTKCAPIKFHCNRARLMEVFVRVLTQAELTGKGELLTPFLRSEVLGPIFGISAG